MPAQGKSNGNVQNEKINLLMRLFPSLDEDDARVVLSNNKWDFQQSVSYLVNEMGFAAAGVAGQAAASASVPMSEEEQLKQAIELSKKTAMESDIQRALEMSRRDAKNVPEAMDIDIPGISPEDVQLQSVISASIQTGASNISVVSTDPNTRKRTEGMPVGIQNVGNTCYFNSFIQTYFMIPQICKEILTFPIEKIENEKKDPKDNDTKNFMKELQRLFGLMAKTNQKWVDPSRFLKSIVDNTGQIVRIGSQEDVSEFSELFLQRLEKGLELSGEGRGRLVRELFYVEVVQYISWQEDDGSCDSVQQTVEFTNFLLPVNKMCSDLHASLEAFMWDVVDYKTPKGRNTKAESSKWLRRLPHILMFQENRVVYDLTSKNQQKVQLPLHFEKTIYMDRYVLVNKDETLRRRGTVSKWREQLRQIEAQIDEHLHFQHQNVPLETFLTGTLEYLNKLPPTDETQTAIKLLNERLLKERETFDALTREANILRKQINDAYADLNKHVYELFAVWIHSGQPSSGHYWAYIKDLRLNKWIKFNDILVSFVDENVVFNDAIGSTESSVSAYFLIYMSREFAQNAQQYLDYEKFIPPFLLKEIEESNKKFAELLENYNKNSDEGRVQRFVDQFENRVKQSIEFANSSIDKDMRVKSLYAFLYSLGMKEQMQALIIKDLWPIVFERGIDKDINTKVYNLAKQKIENGDELFRLAVDLQLACNDSIKALIEQHQKFQETFLYLSAALAKFFEKRYDEALRCLVMAWKKNETLDSDKAKRADIPLILRTVLLVMWHEAVENITQNESVPLIEDVITAATHLLNSTDPLLHYIRNSFLSDVLMHQGRIPPKIFAKFEQLSEILFIEEKRPLPQQWTNLTIKLYSEPEQYELTLHRTKEMLSQFREIYGKYLQRAQSGSYQNESTVETTSEQQTTGTSDRGRVKDDLKEVPALEDSDSMQE
jgi:ubiquitin C-terminal hydrolase